MFRSFLQAMRPKTLVASLSPVLLGSASAYYDGFLNWKISLAVLVSSMFIQIGTDFVNDLYDFKRGADTERLGPRRSVASGLVSPSQMKIAIYVVFFFAFISGMYIVANVGIEMLIIGLLSILAGYSYTGGPFPLAYNALGEVFVFLFFGLVATNGTYYAITHSFSTNSFYISMAVGMLSSALLVVNNIRDIETDANVHKRTLAVVIGKKNSQLQYIFHIIFAYAIVLALFIRTDNTWLCLPLLVLPMGISLMKRIFIVRGVEYNSILFKTSLFSLLFSILLSISILIW